MSHPDPLYDASEQEREDDDLRWYEEECHKFSSSFEDYWRKREQDRRDEREFWSKWTQKFSKAA